MNEKAKHAGVQSWGDGSRLVVAVLIPLVAFAVQWVFWEDIQPYAWFLFFPAVFSSSWVGRLWGGLLATVLSTLLVWYFFIPPHFSFALEHPVNLVSIIVFVGMGILFSLFHERLRQTKQMLNAEEELRASEQRLRLVTENAHVGLVVVNREHRYVYANAAYGKILNLPSTDIIGLRVAEVLNELYTEQVKPRLDRAFAGERVTFELHKPLNGADRYYAVTYEPDQTVTGQEAEVVVVVIFDITGCKQSEAATQRLAAIVEYSEDAIIGKNLDGVVTSWNAGAEKIFGYTAEEMVGSPFSQLIPPDRQGEEEMILARIQGGESVQHFETVRRKKNGGLIDVSVTVSPIKDAAGKIIGASKVARDITERKQVETALRRSEAQLNFALQTSGIGAWDLNLIDNTASRTLIHEQIFGYAEKLSQWTYAKFLEHVLPEDRAEVDRRFQEAVRTQSDWKFECRIRRVDGVVRWILAAGGHHKDAQGKSVRLSGIVQDITERHDAEAKLRESEEKFTRLFDSNPAATSVTTIKDGCYVNVNAAWLKKFEWARDEVINHTVHELGIWPDLAKRQALFDKLKEQGWVQNFEIQLRTKSGQLKQFIWSGVRLTLNGEECLLERRWTSPSKRQP